MNSEFIEYLEDKDEKFKESFIKIIEIIDDNIPKGYQKGMQFGFPSYYIPLKLYEKGYMGNVSEPLPFLSIGIQKNHLAIYHMGIYADEELLSWFKEEYPKHMNTKLNMGKSCIRFTNPKNIPCKLIGELIGKITVDEWINIVESMSLNEL